MINRCPSIADESKNLEEARILFEKHKNAEVDLRFIGK
jgi:hypothetical protein